VLGSLYSLWLAGADARNSCACRGNAAVIPLEDGSVSGAGAVLLIS